MRTPKPLYAQQRTIYQPELLTCPHCGNLLMLCNYLAWDKTVQTLHGVLSVVSRPGCCRHATCEGANLRLLSAEAQGIALPGSTQYRKSRPVACSTLSERLQPRKVT